jgi:hypothetical protein
MIVRFDTTAILEFLSRGVGDFRRTALDTMSGFFVTCKLRRLHFFLANLACGDGSVWVVITLIDVSLAHFREDLIAKVALIVIYREERDRWPW